MENSLLLDRVDSDSSMGVDNFYTKKQPNGWLLNGAERTIERIAKSRIRRYNIA